MRHPGCRLTLHFCLPQQVTVPSWPKVPALLVIRVIESGSLAPPQKKGEEYGGFKSLIFREVLIFH